MITEINDHPSSLTRLNSVDYVMGMVQDDANLDQ